MSLFAWSVAQQRNAGSFKLYPRLLQRRRTVDSCPTFCSSPTVTTEPLLKGSNEPSSSSLFSAPRSFGRTFLFPLSSCSITPFLCRGVVFRSPPATRGRPRWPTKGGGGTERLLFTKDRLSLQTIFRSLRRRYIGIKTLPCRAKITPAHNYSTIMIAANLWSVSVYCPTFCRKCDIWNILTYIVSKGQIRRSVWIKKKIKWYTSWTTTELLIFK